MEIQVLFPGIGLFAVPAVESGLVEMCLHVSEQPLRGAAFFSAETTGESLDVGAFVDCEVVLGEKHFQAGIALIFWLPVRLQMPLEAG